MAALPSDWIKTTLEVSATMVVAAIGLGAITYSRRVARERESITTTGDLMAEFQKAYDAGEIDAEEFRRVRDSLTGRKSKILKPIGAERDTPRSEQPGSTDPGEVEPGEKVDQ